MRLAAGWLITLVLCARAASAQMLPAAFPSVGAPGPLPPQTAPATHRPSVGRPILGGLLGGSVGFWSGLFIAGNIAEENCDNEDINCLLTSILAGAAIGESVLMPVGIHLGNGRRGNLPLGLLASAGIAGLGIAATAATAEPAFLVSAAVGQLVVGVWVERRTSPP